MKSPKFLKRKRNILVAAMACLVGVLVVSAVIVHRIYSRALQPLSNSQQIILVEIPSGFSTQQISNSLEEKGVIRESWAFEWYVRNRNQREDLKAGTYALRPSQDVPEIVSVLAKGVVATDLVTIVPGQRIDQIEATLINSGFSPSDVKRALNPALYKNHPALVDKPVDANLEGYLYPESFQKTADTKASDIVRASLDEMQKRLTPSVRAGIAKKGLSVHQGLILASIVEREVAREVDRPVVAQIFLRRLNEGARLESDATAGYGAILDGEEPSLLYDSKYNTYKHAGLPPGPISNIEITALMAVVAPAKTDYYYFVSGDDGKTHFSQTLAEHEANIEKYCKILCS